MPSGTRAFRTGRIRRRRVSVPFSMGTVLLLGSGSSIHEASTCFSPLLDGDGVASRARPRTSPWELRFQSPSRWGRCCFPITSRCHIVPLNVSVPFSMGTVLLRALQFSEAADSLVSVPFSMGTVLLRLMPPAHIARSRVSVPFSMGTVLLHFVEGLNHTGESRFSPLLDGDGVASSATAPIAAHVKCFSPLLDGDGVASTGAFTVTTTLTTVSVPFSMGTVLLLWISVEPFSR